VYQRLERRLGLSWAAVSPSVGPGEVRMRTPLSSRIGDVGSGPDQHQAVPATREGDPPPSSLPAWTLASAGYETWSTDGQTSRTRSARRESSRPVVRALVEQAAG
jgi:hypothetical protein